MMKLVLTKLGLELRRNIPLLLFCAVCYYFLSFVIMMAVFTQRVWEMPEVQHIYQSDSPELIQNFLTGLLTQEYSAFACGIGDSSSDAPSDRTGLSAAAAPASQGALRMRRRGEREAFVP